MKRELNRKNKIFISLFVVIILAIIGILVYSVKLTGYKNNNVYTVTDNHILYADDFSNVNTKKGGKIEKSWDGEYRFISNDNVSYPLGNSPVVYDSTSAEVTVIGKKYQVLSDGSVNEVNDTFNWEENDKY